MILKVYSIYDVAAKAYMQPFFMHNDGLALRAFQDNVNTKEENQISKHPEQFTLFCLGEYDDSKGQFQSLEAPKAMAVGTEVLMEKKYPAAEIETIIRKVLEEK